ncbi:hypothetical protein RZS08_34075, partial [Arthrospira platensis SPKY1]|nr:hypothetical protein [Arthrospira platensis SPKY1]
KMAGALEIIGKVQVDGAPEQGMDSSPGARGTCDAGKAPTPVCAGFLSTNTGLNFPSKILL